MFEEGLPVYKTELENIKIIEVAIIHTVRLSKKVASRILMSHI